MLIPFPRLTLTLVQLSTQKQSSRYSGVDITLSQSLHQVLAQLAVERAQVDLLETESTPTATVTTTNDSPSTLGARSNLKNPILVPSQVTDQELAEMAQARTAPFSAPPLPPSAAVTSNSIPIPSRSNSKVFSPSSPIPLRLPLSPISSQRAHLRSSSPTPSLPDESPSSGSYLPPAPPFTTPISSPNVIGSPILRNYPMPRAPPPSAATSTLASPSGLAPNSWGGRFGGTPGSLRPLRLYPEPRRGLEEDEEDDEDDEEEEEEEEEVANESMDSSVEASAASVSRPIGMIRSARADLSK